MTSAVSKEYAYCVILPPEILILLLVYADKCPLRMPPLSKFRVVGGVPVVD
jgi:hypothetical protein